MFNVFDKEPVRKVTGIGNDCKLLVKPGQAYPLPTEIPVLL